MELFPEEQILPLIPEFMQPEKEELRGAARGTAYHRVLEKLDYSRAGSLEEVEKQIAQMKDGGKIDESTALSVRKNQIAWFTTSPLGRRMGRAQEQGKLWKEQQFVLSIPASERNPQWNPEQQILLQGIIDAYFEEEDGLILVDYKTDYVEQGREQELIEKYRIQLIYYADVYKRQGYFIG